MENPRTSSRWKHWTELGLAAWAQAVKAEILLQCWTKVREGKKRIVSASLLSKLLTFILSFCPSYFLYIYLFIFFQHKEVKSVLCFSSHLLQEIPMTDTEVLVLSPHFRHSLTVVEIWKLAFETQCNFKTKFKQIWVLLGVIHLILSEKDRYRKEHSYNTWNSTSTSFNFNCVLKCLTACMNIMIWNICSPCLIVRPW